MASVEDDDSATSETVGLATTRSRREKKGKSGRLDALKRIRDLKTKGQRITYEVKEVDNVYDEIDENTYSDKVQERLEDDWIVDDGAGDYVDDGREIFDEERDQPPKQGNPKPSNHSKKFANKKKIKVVKSSDIKNMLMASGAKKKASKNFNMSNDELLGDILQEMNSQPSNALSMPRLPVMLKKKKISPSTPVSVDGVSPIASSSLLIDAPVMSPPSSLPKRRMKPRKIEPQIAKFENLQSEFDLNNEAVTPPAKRTKRDFHASDNLNQSMSAYNNDSDSTDKTPSVKVEQIEFNDDDFDYIDFTETEAKPNVEKKVEPMKVNCKSFMEQLTSLGWNTVKQESVTEPSNIVIDSSKLPLFSKPDGEQVFRFYWLDAYEDQYNQPGVVYLFGKVYIESAKRYVSCSLTVKNIDRKIYVLPRDTHRKTGEDVNPQMVYQEFDSHVAENNRIMKFKTKIVEKNNVFGGPGIPHLAQYLEITYPAQYGQLPAGISGDTFQCIFGVNQSSLEALLMEQRIKGPGWMDVKKAQMNTQNISWCKIEATALSPTDIVVVDNLTPPPLVILSVSMKTLPNLKSHQNEIVGIAGLFHNEFPIDKSAPKPAFQKSFYAISKPPDCVYPYDFRDAIKQKGFDVEIFGTERSLLCFFLVKILKIDPDVIIGHDLQSFDLDVLLHRITACKVPHWSRIGRLKKQNIPKILGGGRFSDRSIATGRILCDIKISAKELIRCKSYDLTALADQVLHRQRKELPTEEIKNMFMTSESLLWMIEHTFMDASLLLEVTCELNALPLALQITNIAGNVLSRTLMGGRSERNEFLLLHAFHEKGFIPPDKVYKKKESASKDNDGKPRKKAAYEGGLVLDPKRGFYDKFILLLDFNSLYPSIIQEFNICFTTIDRHPPQGSEVELETYIPEMPESGLDPGVLPTEIRKLVERRKQVKRLLKDQSISKDQYIQYDIRQKALKLTANSMYGCLGFSNSRFYAKPLAAMVTRQGREILMHTKELAQRMGLEVIYGDTDSIMINTNSTDMDHAFKLGNQVKAEVNKLYRLLEIDIDGVYKSLLLLKKKKYAALSVQRLQGGGYKTVQELKGLDIVRRDWCDLAKIAGNFAVNQILSDQPCELIVEKIHENLQEVGRKVNGNEYSFEMYQIRKELTREPHLYPGKDSLPHVRVAIRVNSSMTKRLKAGDIVSYVICEDGTTAPATHRAYTVDEIKHSNNLKVDSEYYLSQQVHPVVTRLCDPIDGTDAALIAQFLGLDSGRFKRTRDNEVDEEERLINVQATEEERYQGCRGFVFSCPQSGKEIKFDSGVFVETDPTYKCSLAQLCGENDSKTVADFLVSLQNQLTVAINSDIKKYYEGWLCCDDPACSHRTRNTSVLHDKNGPVCPICFKGVLRSEVTYKSLFQQLCFYKLQFDVEYALKKYKQDGNKPDATPST